MLDAPTWAYVVIGCDIVMVVACWLIGRHYLTKTEDMASCAGKEAERAERAADKAEHKSKLAGEYLAECRTYRSLLVKAKQESGT